MVIIMDFIKKNTDVFIAPGPISFIGQVDIEFLRGELLLNLKGRVRINIHSEDSDALHEMFIAIRADSYIQPHKHLVKSEAFHVIYGQADVVIFNDDGSILQVVPLAARELGNSKAFYYRMSKPYFHTLIIKSDFLVVHEITNGPFLKTGTDFAAFAPSESASPDDIINWRKKLSSLLEQAK